mgnify:CR=1 FL=1
MDKKKKKKKISNGAIGGIAIGVLLIVIVLVCIFGLCRVPVGYEAVIYNMNGGVEETTLKTGWHILAPTKKAKQFTTSNEQLILTKDERKGSKEDESFRVASADNASIAISFQMSYRFNPDMLVDTYKKFKGMNGEDIVNNRVTTVLKSRVSEITTDYSLMELYSGNRAEINDKITKYLDEKFSTQFGLEVIDASIIDVHPDSQLKEAINKRIEAQQKADQAKAEQETAKVEAETKKIQAQNEADIEVLKAEAEAKANKTIAQSLTPELIEQSKIEKWNGKLPKVQGNSNAIIDARDITN